MANKKITDATAVTSMAGTDKLFVNSGGDLKQIELDKAVAASTPVKTLNSNLSVIFGSQSDLRNKGFDTTKTPGIYFYNGWDPDIGGTIPFTSSFGCLYVYKTSYNSIYQVCHCFVKNSIFTRFFDLNSKEWTEWREIQ